MLSKKLYDNLCCHNCLIVLVFLTFVIPSRSFGELPDTGQTKCYNNTGETPCPAPGEPFFGQDGNYQGFPPTYQVSGDGLVITDLNTGLMWQQINDGILRDWVSSFSYCEGLTLGGYEDWRMPTRNELVSIVDYGRYDPTINPVFSITYYENFWTGSSSNIPDNACTVFFENGYQGHMHKIHQISIRCVRNGR